jgi:hypothetical protein
LLFFSHLLRRIRLLISLFVTAPQATKNKLYRSAQERQQNRSKKLGRKTKKKGFKTKQKRK